MACCRDLHLTTHNTDKETDIHATARFKPTFPARKQPQAYALDLEATGIGKLSVTLAQTYFDLFSVTL